MCIYIYIFFFFCAGSQGSEQRPGSATGAQDCHAHGGVANGFPESFSGFWLINPGKPKTPCFAGSMTILSGGFL